MSNKTAEDIVTKMSVYGTPIGNGNTRKGSNHRTVSPSGYWVETDTHDVYVSDNTITDYIQSNGSVLPKKLDNNPKILQESKKDENNKDE